MITGRQCGICRKTGNLELRKCCKCGTELCEECVYYSRFYRRIKESPSAEVTQDEELYFCKSHFIVFVHGLDPALLEDMLKNNFTVTGHYEEGNRKIFYTREFRGDGLKSIIDETIPSWPSDQWKDWNTM